MLGLSGRRVDLLTDSFDGTGRGGLRCRDGTGGELTHLQRAWAEEEEDVQDTGMGREGR